MLFTFATRRKIQIQHVVSIPSGITTVKSGILQVVLLRLVKFLHFDESGDRGRRGNWFDGPKAGLIGLHLVAHNLLCATK